MHMDDFDNDPFDLPESTEVPVDREDDDAMRRPRIALMGEFSAGKSTLSNLLIGSSPLPMKVTATQLPPVWISWGNRAPYRKDLDGDVRPVDLDGLGDIDPSETRYIRLYLKSDILRRCDIIDMPGISDPNMSSDVWERMIHKADGVIWCTHATQAWRQSEAAVWETMDEALQARSLLLVTRFDKLLSEVDRRRVMKRVAHETADLFVDRLPISLVHALVAKNDPATWESCGAKAFFDRFGSLLNQIASDIGAPFDEIAEDPPVRGPEPNRRPRPVSVTARPVLEIGATRTERPVSEGRVVPARVRVTSRRPSVRPAFQGPFGDQG